MPEPLEIQCPKCKGYSKDIKVVYIEHQQKLRFACDCGEDWEWKVKLGRKLEPPEVDIWIERGTGLICVRVTRWFPNNTKKSICIKLTEEALIETAKGATTPVATTITSKR